MSGYVGDLSPGQEDALAKFKEAIKDVERDDLDDHECLRWLRARKFNLEKAEEMLRAHVEFRKQWKVDTILEDFKAPEVLNLYYPRAIYGVDRDGDPISYNAIGNIDFRGLYRSVAREDMLRFIISLSEQGTQVIKELSKESGRRVERFTQILDMENLSYQRHYFWPGIKFFQETLSLLEANYPERIKQVFIIKAPKVFPVAYNLMKPFLDEETRQKVQVFGASWREDLQKYIHPDQLPEYYGGTQREPDAKCSDKICLGGDVPPQYFLTNLTETPLESMSVLQVGRGSSSQVEYPVYEPGTAIRWEFVTKDHDIGFGVFSKPLDQDRKLHAGDMAVHVSSSRKSSHVVPESGYHVCEETGIYVLRFDNTYSWTRTKVVHYSVLLHPPDQYLPDQAASATQQDKRGEDQADSGQQKEVEKEEEKEEEEEEDAFEDALEGLELRSSNPSSPLAAKEGKNAKEGWMAEAAAIPTPSKLSSTSTEV